MALPRLSQADRTSTEGKRRKKNTIGLHLQAKQATEQTKPSSNKRRHDGGQSSRNAASGVGRKTGKRD